MLRLIGKGGVFALMMAVLGCSNLPNGTTTGENTLQTGLLSRLKTAPAQSGKVLHRAPMSDDKVVIAAPKGYCIDQKSLTDTARGGFALLASCAGLTGRTDGEFVKPAIMTITVLPRRFGAQQPNADMLAATAPSGKNKVLERIDGDGLSLVHLATGGRALSENSDSKYWRGAMVINGHVVGLAVYAPKGSALAGQDGRKLAMALAEQLRTHSPVKDYTPVATAAQNATNLGQETNRPVKNRLKKLFPRL